MKKNECPNCGESMKTCKGKLNCKNCNLHKDNNITYPTLSMDMLKSNIKISWQVVFYSKISKGSDALQIKINPTGKDFYYSPLNGVSFKNDEEAIYLANNKIAEILSVL